MPRSSMIWERQAVGQFWVKINSDGLGRAAKAAKAGKGCSSFAARLDRPCLCYYINI